jgi:hypothetical protein
MLETNESNPLKDPEMNNTVPSEPTQMSWLIVSYGMPENMLSISSSSKQRTNERTNERTVILDSWIYSRPKKLQIRDQFPLKYFKRVLKDKGHGVSTVAIKLFGIGQQESATTY